MLSLYAILILTVTSSVFGEQNETCQSGDDSCCEGYECVALEGGDGTKFCMEKNATVLALNESCKGFKKNCDKGLTCKKSCAKGEKCKDRVCVKPLAEGEGCMLENDRRSRNCGKGLKCHKKTGVCVQKKGKG